MARWAGVGAVLSAVDVQVLLNEPVALDDCLSIGFYVLTAEQDAQAITREGARPSRLSELSSHGSLSVAPAR
ncbi:uncharacterized protein F5Z01DRAFT_656068 [Emericellopsis atlantica]|uniref:Uncharacterized protein n=1 Tax=Emericellopsis atlantica TaxID=2614577 RepID=A0A9P7ZLD3_9HYPO|nr:uncharacterized protein F5Z01DRAFT_656068 [Emericellopsis atlantica]KAG9254140.1 hypothetical protein F5Z01DRAFT_656068 [Emericellopsis atlantica]